MFRKITLFSVVLTLIVIVSGSYLRLSGAELACPDWPGCFGQALVSDNAGFMEKAAAAFPDQVPDIAKARKVMTYRYLTGGLGLLIFLSALLAWREKQCRFTALTSTWSLLILVALQSAFGLWIVKTQAMPLVVAGLTVLEMMTFWLLFGLYLRSNPAVEIHRPVQQWPRYFAWIAMSVLFAEIVLGAWVSANHAALACTGFPKCNGQWWPEADYRGALDLLHGLFSGYYGVIAYAAQVAALWLHRAGALFCFILLSLLMVNVTSARYPKQLGKAGLLLSLLLFVQIGLGVVGFKLGNPLWAVLAHHVCSALLMLPLIAISFYSKYGFAEAQPKAVEVSPITAPIAAAPAEEIYVEPEPESLYLRLKSQLKRTRGALAGLSIGQKGINEDLLEEMEAALLMADVGIDATTEIINRLTQRLERHQLNDGVALKAALKQELLDILKPCSQPLQIPEQDTPFVILVVGVNGAGKTTTIGKLAKRLQTQGKTVMLAAGDTFRAAAVEQLQTWGERNNIHVVAQHTGADSASVIYDAVQSANAKGIDVLIADTAGRLHTKSNLMDELKKVKRIMAKLDETAPHEVLLVLDAGTGQNALSQAKLFNEAVALTGLVLTKLDGTAKGGVIFALAKYSGIPIRYIGIGERIDDLQDFDAENFVDALFVRD